MPGGPRRQGRGGLPVLTGRSPRPRCSGRLGAGASALPPACGQHPSVASRDVPPRRGTACPCQSCSRPRRVASPAELVCGAVVRGDRAAPVVDSGVLERIPDVVDAQVGPRPRPLHVTKRPSSVDSPAGDERAWGRGRAAPRHARAWLCRRGYVAGRSIITTADDSGPKRCSCRGERAKLQECLFFGRHSRVREVPRAAAPAQYTQAHTLLYVEPWCSRVAGPFKSTEEER